MRSGAFIIFLILINIFILAIDLYFFKHWRKFIKSWNLNPLFYRIPFFLTIPMALISVYTTSFRIKDPVISGYMIIVFSFVILWYFPKILLLPFFLIKDIFNLIAYLKKLIFSHKYEPEPKIFNAQRRKLLKTAAWGLAPIPFFYVADGLARTTRNVKVYPVEIPVFNLPEAFDGLKIAQISDIHAGSFSNSNVIKMARELILDIKPDIILVTGDLVNFHPDEMNIIFEEFNKLKAPHGVYGIFGNHDHYMDDANHEKLIRIVKNSSVDLLINENRVIKINGEDFQLAGIDNLGFRQTFGDLDSALAGIDESKFILLMSHDPTSWDKYIVNKKNIELTLSGHTHGGQVGLEFFGKELSPAEIAYKQWAGLYTKGNQSLYVNRGLGTTGPPIRLAFDPEVTSIILRKA